jgi:hypothetical protein
MQYLHNASYKTSLILQNHTYNNSNIFPLQNHPFIPSSKHCKTLLKRASREKALRETIAPFVLTFRCYLGSVSCAQYVG